MGGRDMLRIAYKNTQKSIMHENKMTLGGRTDGRVSGRIEGRVGWADR